MKQIKSIFLILLLFCVIPAFAQNTKVTGTVTDATTSEPIGFVSIQVVGTTTVVMSNEDGSYTLQAPANATLAFSFMGYNTLEIPINGRTQVDAQMAQSVELLEELVVVGFGTQKKTNLTGAVSQVKMDELLGDRPVTNSAAVLQGAIPGLQVTGSSTPGQNNKSFQIRGVLSINGGSPLVLIDNVPGSIDMLNPDDIEAVSVLKDAASAAIYGARAAGGVILISTKKPSKQSKFTLNYSNNFGFENAINKPQQAPLSDYFKAYTDAGLTNTYWSNSQNISKWVEFAAQYKENPSSLPTIGDGIYVYEGIPYYLNEKDLYENFMTTGAIQTHNMSVSGGSDRVRFRISGGYNQEDGPLITSKDAYKRYNVSAYVGADVTKWFTQEIDMRYSSGTKTMPVDNIGGLYTLRLISYYPEGDMPGEVTISGEDTPIFTPRNIILNSNNSTSITENPRILLKSTIKPFKDFNVVFEYTFDKNQNEYSFYSGQWDYTTIQLGTSKSVQSDYLNKTRSYTNYNAINVYANYNKSFGKHNLSAMAGYNQESSYYAYVYNIAYDQAVQSVPSFGGATGKVQNTDSYSEYAIRGGFGRISYNYDNKYLLELNGRYDGSSKFPKNGRFGFFPSVSAGWHLGKESFMGWADSWMQELKLRASYGSIGNQAISPYQYSPSMSIAQSSTWLANDDYVTAIGVPALVSSGFTWETVTTLNLGVDFGLFKNRLQGSFEWYQRDTEGMLTAGVELPSVVGASAPMQNAASMRTHGWELSVNWSDQIGKFGYRFGFNVYDRTSWITKYDNASGLLSDYYVGRTINELWGYTAAGYYTIEDFENTTTWKLKEGVPNIQGYNVKPGDVKYVNLLDDESSTNQIDAGNSTLDNPGDRTIIGNTTPRYQFGANLGFNFAGFDLNVLIQGVGKRDYWLGGQAIFPFAGSGATDAVFQPIYYNQTDYWTPISTDPSDPNYMVASNPDATLFRIYNQMENVGSNTRTSDKYLQNAAYLRVKNVTLSYTFPAKWMRKMSVQQLRLFGSVENLATFTSLPQGFDPESLSWSYPFYRTISFGASITF